MASDKKNRINSTLPEFHRKWLKVWAFLKCTTPTALAGNILQARIEANLDLISRMVAERSEDEGLTVEEFIKKIVNDSDDDQEKPTR